MNEMRRVLAALLFAFSAGIVACGGEDDSGACVSEVRVGPSYTYCSDDWEKQECEDFAGGSTYHGGETCEDLGYDYYCADTYTYHMSSANCN